MGFSDLLIEYSFNNYRSTNISSVRRSSTLFCKVLTTTNNYLNNHS